MQSTVVAKRRKYEMVRWVLLDTGDGLTRKLCFVELKHKATSISCSMNINLDPRAIITPPADPAMLFMLSGLSIHDKNA